MRAHLEGITLAKSKVEPVLGNRVHGTWIFSYNALDSLMAGCISARESKSTSERHTRISDHRARLLKLDPKQPLLPGTPRVMISLGGILEQPHVTWIELDGPFQMLVHFFQ